MSVYQVGYIVGSLSTESINRTLAAALIRLAPPHLKFVEIPILNLPLYNRDFDTDYPQRAMRSRMRSLRRKQCYSCPPSTTGASRAA
jgi:chromate reductase